MSYWLNDRLGIAFESNEGGTRLWDPETQDFCKALPSAELRALNPWLDCRRCSEDEAFAYMEAKNAEQNPGN